MALSDCRQNPGQSINLEKGLVMDRNIVEKLIEALENVAKGIYSNDIMEFTKPEYAKSVQRIAEAMGMMMVRVEAREMRLEELVADLRQANIQLRDNILDTVTTIANALEARDEYTRGHSQRVANYSRRLAMRLELPREEVINIKLGGMLHDIGKIGFSDNLFSNFECAPSDEMREEIVQHPLIGEKILKDLHFLGPILKYVRYHHERIDGQGYPYGLRGPQIPDGAKIISVADCFDAITTNRPYQKKRSPNQAFKILRDSAGNALEKDMVFEFIAEIQENGVED